MEEPQRKKIFKLKKTAIIIGMVFLAVFLMAPVLAQQPPPLNLGLEYAEYTGLANTDIRIIIAKIIRAALGLLGLVALCFTIYGGYMYMTAGGNEEKITTAKKILKNMVIGLAIILSALGIVQFIINAIYNEYEARYAQPEWPSGYTEEMAIGGFLGSVIESHYPRRNAFDIPRNTKIVVTFKQKISPTTLILDTNGNRVFGGAGDGDQINSDNVKIYISTEGTAKALGMNPTDPADDVFAYLSADGRTIVFQPKNYLGNSLSDTNYTVKLTNGVKLIDNSDAFRGIGGYYSWPFTVSPRVDLTPPQVESVFPVPSSRDYPRNIIVQMNFNEAVDPISASGIFRTSEASKNFQNITMVSSTLAGPVTVDGEYRITNQYRTVEFVSDNQCDVNACGQPIFCLPENKTLTVTAKTPTLSNNPPQALITANLYDGVVDMAGNVLNGGGELKRDNQGNLILAPGVKKSEEWQGQTGEGGFAFDDFFWKFNTSATFDTTAPQLSDRNPDIDKTEGVSPVSPLLFTFNKPMALSSFRNIILKTNKDFNVWYTPAGRHFTTGPTVVTSPDQEITFSQAELLHGDFWQKPVGSTEPEAIYYPFVPSTVTDIYQNCFYQAVGPGCSTSDLSDTKPSCYDGEAKAGASLCGAGEICPFSPAPRP